MPGHCIQCSGIVYEYIVRIFHFDHNIYTRYLIQFETICVISGNRYYDKLGGGNSVVRSCLLTEVSLYVFFFIYSFFIYTFIILRLARRITIICQTPSSEMSTYLELLTICYTDCNILRAHYRFRIINLPSLHIYYGIIARNGYFIIRVRSSHTPRFEPNARTCISRPVTCSQKTCALYTRLFCCSFFIYFSLRR